MYNVANLGCSSQILMIVNERNFEFNKRWILDIRKASLKKVKSKEEKVIQYLVAVTWKMTSKV